MAEEDELLIKSCMNCGKGMDEEAIECKNCGTLFSNQ